jgi:Cu/Ag efflux pump CusA
MEVNDKEMAVRGIGLIRSVADIENIVLTQEEDR